MKCIKNEKGFTLIEIVISIAMFSIASVVVLRLFVTSHQLNEALRISDMSHVETLNVIEMIKSYDSIEELLRDEDWLLQDHPNIYGEKNLTTYLDTKDVYMLYVVLVEDVGPVGLYEIKLIVKDEQGEEVVSYTTKHYFKGERMDGF